jgi:hypothetical protein
MTDFSTFHSKTSACLAVVLTAGLFFGCSKESKRNLPPIGKAGEGALVSTELIYSLDDRPTTECHASTIAEIPGGLIAAWFGGTEERHPDVGIWTSFYEKGEWSEPVEVTNVYKTIRCVIQHGIRCCSCQRMVH